MGVALGYLQLERVIPGVAERGTEERRYALPLRIRTERLAERLGSGEAGINRRHNLKKIWKRHHLEVWEPRLDQGRSDGQIEKRQIAGAIRIQTGRLNHGGRESIVGKSGKQWSGPPSASIADVGEVHHRSANHFALHADAPLRDARKTAGVAVDGNERRLGRRVAGRGLERIVRGEVRPCERRISERVARRERKIG